MIKHRTAARRFLAAGVAVLALAGTAVGTAQASSGGTPDGSTFSWGGYGWVTWLDDGDNFALTDRRGDGKSIELRVLRGVPNPDTAHAYGGETIVRNFGNLKDGHKVYFQLCGSDNGKPSGGCSTEVWWEE
ncbi:hypothetical protein [Streptomyces sp. NPDC005989]|uniref:hypothetical protein n=1 Tax=Streptomyces sp. NPDC005989 TaxID=3156727 RepID=UPI0033E5F973